MPVGIDAIVTIEGKDNFQENYSPAIGAVVSRKLGAHGAIYAQPIWINNTNSLPSEVVDDNDTFIIGVGGRFRIRPKLYLVAEAAPRFGYDPGITYASFAHRDAGGRPLVPDQLLGRLRHDHGADGPRRLRQRRLVSGVQHLAEILLRQSQAGPRNRHGAGQQPGRTIASRHHREDIVISKKQSLTFVAVTVAFSLAYACGGSSTAPSSNPGGGTGSPGTVGATITIGSNGALSPATVTINNRRERQVREQPQQAAPDVVRSAPEPHRLPADQRAADARPRTKRADQRADDVADVRDPRSSQRPEPSLRGSIVIR